MSRTLEELLEEHRPPPETEALPCGKGQLHHLNVNGLLEEAIAAQALRDSGTDDPEDAPGPIVITRIVAWEVLSRAQLDGLRLRQDRPSARQRRARRAARR